MWFVPLKTTGRFHYFWICYCINHIDKWIKKKNYIVISCETCWDLLQMQQYPAGPTLVQQSKFKFNLSWHKVVFLGVIISNTSEILYNAMELHWHSIIFQRNATAILSHYITKQREANNIAQSPSHYWKGKYSY